MRVFYYYYYLFYTKILSEGKPHATTIFTLSMSQSFILIGIIDLIITQTFCISIGKWKMIGLTLIVILANYFIYGKSGKNLEIINSKPKFFNSNFLSIIITILFFVISVSVLFWGPVYTKNVLAHCK
jgi:hypothetical protein